MFAYFGEVYSIYNVIRINSATSVLSENIRRNRRGVSNDTTNKLVAIEWLESVYNDTEIYWRQYQDVKQRRYIRKVYK